MRSTFSCYQVAKSGIYTNQRALEVLGHNISNANTPGYVRQQVLSAEKTPIAYGRNQIGTGVDVGEVRQIRSIFLDKAYRSENGLLRYWEKKQATVENIEAVFDEMSNDNGIGNAIEQFFEGWEELEKDPQSRTVRESVREYGNDFADIVNQLAEQLGQMQADLDTQINAMVDEINATADAIAVLNQKILAGELNGENANDYRDELNSLLDTLSGYVKIDAYESESGMFNVTLGGVYLVNGSKSQHMSCETNSSNGAFTTVTWENTGMEVKLKEGELLGLIESRGDVNGDKGSAENGSPLESGEEETDVDNDSEVYNFSPDSENLISELRKGLNMLVSLMTRKVNAIHSSGIGLDGSTGVAFFVKIDENLPFEAGNIKVNRSLEDPEKIAASETGESGDVSIANKLVDFRDEAYFQSDSLKMDIDDFYTLLVDWVGTIGQEAEGFVSNQNILLQQTQNKRDSLSAVSLDEEMSNIIKYQHSYTASANVMNTIDAMIDQIINRMGIVGR